MVSYITLQASFAGPEQAVRHIQLFLYTVYGNRQSQEVDTKAFQQLPPKVITSLYLMAEPALLASNSSAKKKPGQVLQRGTK